MYYTGIGSRKTPEDVLKWMTHLANYLAIMGFTLRSGGANGADKAFEQGANGNCDIYLPWKEFNANQSTLILDDMALKEAAYKIAYQYHPNWMACNAAARAFMARNSFQVLGDDLISPSAFVICWTPNKKICGGTGQAIRIANDHDIPVMYL